MMALFSFAAACSGRGNVDLSKATPITAEPVKTPPNAGTDNVQPYGPLFSHAPGTKIPIASLKGAVDPVGTDIVEDYDGDGIANNKETTTNPWVADYPQIETNIAPPVTMKIQILTTATGQSEEVVTDIASSETQSAQDESSEAAHRNEVNIKTTQYQDSFNNSNAGSYSSESSFSRSFSVASKASFSMMPPVGIGSGFSAEASASGSTSSSSKLSTSYSNAYGETTTKWKDIPYKNNLRKDEKILKRSDAEKQARQFRKDFRAKNILGTEVKSDAGSIRAALYITNESVNLPVRISNILCSLLFETAEGELIAVQSFRLRNDDFSIFTVNLYGGSTFGPYVISLDHLNTTEIREAIAKGYNPKIYIIDYEMEHVPDSNYRAALSSSFTGNNLKIIEENAKGRTAGIKILAPNKREFHRVTAFDTDGTENCAGATGATSIIPGVSLEKALNRVRCGGTAIEFQTMVLDFSGVIPAMATPRFFVRGVKSINGFENVLPGYTVTGTDSETGEQETVFVVKPVAEWTDAELANYRLWAIYDKAKYFFGIGDLKTSAGVIRNFNYTDSQGNVRSVPKMKGITGTVWPGDHYDLVLLRSSAFVQQAAAFGTNPLETNAPLTFNTKWDLEATGPYPFQPNIHSKFLGKVGLGEEIEITLKIDKTKFLNPSFGQPQSPVQGVKIYNNFTYQPREETQKLFSLEEGMDFELSYGLGGQPTDWRNLVRLNQGDLADCGRSWDYMNQTFTLCLRLPDQIAGVASNGLLNLYMRTGLNNAYRNSIWPQDFRVVKKFDSKLKASTPSASTTLTVAQPQGVLADGDQVRLGDGTTPYAVSNVVFDSVLKEYTFTISPGLPADTAALTRVSVPGNLTATEVNLSSDDTFFQDWNLTVPQGYGPLLTQEIFNPVTYCAGNYVSPNCSGYNPAAIITNWLGAGSFSNNWSDAQFYPTFLTQTFSPFLSNAQGSTLTLRVKTENTFEKLVNGTVADQQTAPKVLAVTDTHALVSWQINNNGATEYRARVINLVTGEPVDAQDELLIPGRPDLPVPYKSSTAFEEIFIRTAPSINKAIVVRKNTIIALPVIQTEVHYRIINLAAGLSGSSGEYLLRSTPNLILTTIDYVEVEIANQRAIIKSVLGNNGQNLIDVLNLDTEINENYDPNIGTTLYFGKFSNLPGEDIVYYTENSKLFAIDLKNHILLHNATSLNTSGGATNVGTTLRAQRFNDGGYEKVLTIVDQNFGLGSAGIASCVTNITLLTVRCDPTPFDYATMLDPALFTTNGKMIFSVSQNANGTNMDIRGKYFDTATLTSSVSFLVSTLNFGDQTKPVIHGTHSGDKVFVSWESTDNGLNKNIRGRFFNLITGQPINAQDFLISANNLGDQAKPSVMVYNNKAYTAWESQDSGVDFDIKGRLIILSNEVIYDANINPTFSPLYGLNNFFTAPLIERNYTVTSKIKF